MESRFPRRWPLLSVGTLNLDPVALFCSLCHVYYIGCFVEIRVTEVLRILIQRLRVIGRAPTLTRFSFSAAAQWRISDEVFGATK